MSQEQVRESKHFDLIPLCDGVYACVHKAGGAASSNAGIIDLGDQTLVVDAFNTVAAGRDLRATAETLFGRPVSALVLTHWHDDHWIGASAFDVETLFLATEPTRAACLEAAAELVESFKDRAAWEAELRRVEAQLETETDERVRVGLVNGISRTRYTMAEMAEFKPRCADAAFAGTMTFHGTKRIAEVRSFGRGHSVDDVAVLLPQDGIAFIGDIGFFDTQPFMAYCDLDLYRKELHFLRDSDFRALVPGHGVVGGKPEVERELAYFDVLEGLVGKVVEKGGSLEDASQIALPPPFDQWLFGGMNRFATNVRFMYKHLGGEMPGEG
ncbi:MAG: MBL fold metallo-hydrolase [Candidatus Bipolaricaulota bacterium]|nr:MBL fold metallo-hydrolase [Candidatus Bipolaricaulota bacterium]